MHGPHFRPAMIVPGEGGRGGDTLIAYNSPGIEKCMLTTLEPAQFAQ